MPNTTINWDETAPGANDNAGQGDDQIRSLKSNIRGGLDGEHHWPSTAGGHGAHRKGSARVFVADTLSQVSSSDTDGRLIYQADTARLWVGAPSPFPIGGVGVPIVQGIPGSNNSHHWSIDAGSVTPTFSATSVGITFTSAFSGIPYVQVTPSGSASNPGPYLLTTVARTSGATVYFWGTSGSSQWLSAGKIDYVSIGSRLIG